MRLLSTSTLCQAFVLSKFPHDRNFANCLLVWVKAGICSADSLINICLCLLGYLPGLLHAWYIIAKFPDNDYESIPQDSEAHRVTYVVIQGPNGTQQRVARTAPKPQNRGYGTTSPMAPPVNQAPNGTWNNNAPTPAQGSLQQPVQGSSSGGQPPVPPSYAEAVKGDHKVQSRD
jgi:uncharacterized membrane protein YqaE (UPF0057 family)